MTNEARIESSTVCNYACIFCPHKDLTRTKEIMSIDLYKSIVDKLPSEIEIITLSGLGEMFLDPNIFEKIKYAKQKGYTVNALTNGSMFDGDLNKELIESGIDSIRISIHASNFEKYSKITGANLKNYKAVHSLIDDLHSYPNNIKVIVTVDMLENDQEEVARLRELYENKVDLLEIWKVHNWADWKAYREGAQKKLTCGRPLSGPLQIQVDGTINMCCFDYDGKLELGDLKKETLDEIFSSDMYKLITAFHRGESIEEDILCKHCDQLYEKDESILIYNSEFGSERIGKLSTTYKEMI